MKGLISVAVVIAVAAGCGGVSNPLAPPTAQQIAEKPTNSSMRDGTFTVSGTLYNGATAYPVTGNGSMVLKPNAALKMNLQVDAGGILGRIGVDIVYIADKQYERIGAGNWQVTDAPRTGTAYRGPGVKLIGEEQLPNGKTWHLERVDGDQTYDVWIRQNDGYLLRYISAKQDGTRLQLDFSQFNTGAIIAVPSPATSPTPR